MELTTTQLNYLLACYSMVFSLIGLYFFRKASKIMEETKEQRTNLIQSLEVFFDVLKENVKHEGTDAD